MLMISSRSKGRQAVRSMHGRHVHSLCSQPMSRTGLYSAWLVSTRMFYTHNPSPVHRTQVKKHSSSFSPQLGFCCLFACLFVFVFIPVMEGEKDGTVFSTSGSLSNAFLNASLSCMAIEFLFPGGTVCHGTDVPAAWEYFM